MQVLIDGLDETFLTTASEAQLDWVSPVRDFEYETIDALCAIIAPANTAALTGVDPARQARAQKANTAVRRSLFARTADDKADWVLTLYPTPAAAQNAGLSLRRLRRVRVQRHAAGPGRPRRRLA